MLVTIVLCFMFYVLCFIIIRPFDGFIVEDKPLLAFLCEMQTSCGVGDKVTIPCERGKYNYTWEKLKYWNKFKGCNNETPGFDESSHNIIGIKICGCGGLQ